MEVSVSILFRKMKGLPLSDEEDQAFEEWYAECEEHRLYWKRFRQQQEKIEERRLSVVDVQAGWMRLERGRRKPVRHIVWLSVAASVVVLLGFASVFSFFHQTTSAVVVENGLTGKGVTLKLSDGKNLVLTDKSAIALLDETQASVKVKEGMIQYQVDSVINNEIAYNELKVPVAAEFQVVLADGSKVLLNSSSYLRYPVAFAGNERKVYLEGEAFFIVKPDEKPFIVETVVEEIKVFGTEFNVMTYAEEKQMQTTLVKGSIGVKLKEAPDKDYVKLVPGEQFIIDNNSGQASVKQVDVFPYVAWKDGLFVSQNDNLEAIMQKLARWYDVEVFYQNASLKTRKFWGVMKRKDTLKEILEVIAKAGQVKFEIQGKTVIVSQ